MRKLAIVISHPIQYYAPWFKMLSQNGKIQVKVFYTWSQAAKKVEDSGFGKQIEWDIPLLEGYDYEFINNTSKDANGESFFGIKTPLLIPKIKEWKADAILVFGWNFHSHLKVLIHFKGKIPIYFRGDSNLLDEKLGIKTFLRRNWLRFVYSRISKAFYVGKNNKAYYLKHGLTEKQLIFAPHAIDNNRFSEKSKEKIKQAEKWKSELGIPKNHIVFLFIGKFEEKKDPEIILKAAEKLLDKEISFLFVGNGILEDSLRKQAKKNTNIFFLPFQNQSTMPTVYRLGDVFILPSKGPFETWGLAVNEAMACNKAIIVSDKVGCAVNLVSNNGFIFSSGRVNELVEKINFFYENKEKITEFGINSQVNISKWSFSEICLAIEREVTN